MTTDKKQSELRDAAKVVAAASYPRHSDLAECVAKGLGELIEYAESETSRTDAMLALAYLVYRVESLERMVAVQVR